MPLLYHLLTTPSYTFVELCLAVFAVTYLAPRVLEWAVRRLR